MALEKQTKDSNAIIVAKYLEINRIFSDILLGNINFLKLFSRSMLNSWKLQMFNPKALPTIKNEQNEARIVTVHELLKKTGLEELSDIFQEQAIDLEVITAMHKHELLDMLKDLGINKWGHRFKIQKALELLKKDNTTEANNMTEKYDL